MQSGTVKWFNNAKGYGFIVPESGGEDVFVHYSTIDGSGFKTLKEGQTVQYEASESPRGVQTTRVIGEPLDAAKQQVPAAAELAGEPAS
ncbi:MAG: cold-shock protein [Gammaproteobacteria bacterium]|nr:cold-shock protein [Gammaproteobacteria bacterium]MDH5801078.1 cold-shock protein [Gammaproteobacteria bacterium]